jgi:N utilization substance protein B
VKVMQVLYAMNRDGVTRSAKAAQQYYQRLVDATYHLYLFNLLAFQRVIEYARQDEIRRHSKLRPSEADLAFTAKFANNAYLPSIAKNADFQLQLSRAKLNNRLDADKVRALYIGFAKQEAYQAFIAKSENSREEYIQLYLDLYKYLLNEEPFTDMLEDLFPLWQDDKSLVVGAMKKTIKALPLDGDFLESFKPSAETVTEFGQQLLEKVITSDADLLGLIEPSLKNWDADRVAVLDMIMLKMALAEFLYFASIPTKVTLNEFVDISKLYSTDKSKEFVNGILDRLLRQLTDEKMINKRGRGLT